MKNHPHIALVHDWLTSFSGSEQCLLTLSQSKFLQKAPIYTSVYQDNNNPFLKKLAPKIKTSFLQNFPGITKHYAWYYPLMPLAFESFELKDYDIVISSSHSAAKGIITAPQTKHICYCYTPTRYLWDFWPTYQKEAGYYGIFDGLIRKISPLLVSPLRLWDRSAAQRVDHFVAISKFVASRIKKYYRRNSTIIYPPVDTQSFYQDDYNRQDYFLLISRLVPYKRIDIAIHAFNQLKLPLLIVGEGLSYKKLKKIASPNISFTGYVSEAQKRQLLSRCQALIFPTKEDFGITAVEAQASGRPVIALGQGGSGETVLDGITGIHFANQRAKSLIEAIKSFNPYDFSSSVIRQNALRFDKKNFLEKFNTLLMNL